MANREWRGIAICAAAMVAMAGPCWAQKTPVAPATARQAKPAPAKPAAQVATWKPAGAAQTALSQRVNTYYQDILQKRRTAALELVAAESKSAYYNTDYHSLAGFRVSGMEISKDGTTATVSVMRTVNVAAFPQPMDFPVKDTWERAGGQWYIVLPAGNGLGAAVSSEQTAADAQVKAKMEKASKGIDPAEYTYALEKAVAAQKAKEKDSSKKKSPPKKSDNKKKTDSQAPDKAKSPSIQ